jgi:hypothetical protein
MVVITLDMYREISKTATLKLTFLIEMYRKTPNYEI